MKWFAPVCVVLVAGVACHDEEPAAPHREPLQAPATTRPSISLSDAEVEEIPLVASSPFDVRDVAGLGVNDDGIVAVTEDYQHAVRYPPADTLANPEGLDLHFARAINASGELVGRGSNLIVPRGFHVDRFGFIRWPKSLPNSVFGTEAQTEVVDISGPGEMVGWSVGPADNYVHGVVWTSADAAPIELPSLFPSPGVAVPNGIASGLSGSLRLVAGVSVSLPGGPSVVKPTMWVGTAPTELPGLPGLSNNNGQATAAADNGMIVGSVPMATGQVNPVVWKDGTLHTDLSGLCLTLSGYRFGVPTDIAITGSGRVLITGWCGAGVPVVFSSNSDDTFSAEALSCGSGFACSLNSISSTGYIAGQIQTSTGPRAARWHYTPPPIQPPTVLISGAASNEGSQSQFGAQQAGPQGGALLAIWDWGDGSLPDTAMTLLHRYLDNGTYTITARVWDGTDTTTVMRTVIVPSVEPLVTLVTPTSAVVSGASFQLDATDPIDPSPLDVQAGFTYAFDCGTGLSSPSSVATATCTAGAPGAQSVRVRIADKDGAFSDILGTVTVVANSNEAPGLTTIDPYSGVEGTAISLAVTATDPDGDALSYTWDFGDGTTATGSSLTHTWNDNGTYAVRVIVSDGQLSDTATTTATISNAPPFGTSSAPTVGLAQDQPFTITVSGASDLSAVDQQSLTFRFNCGAGWTPWGVANSASCVARGSPGGYMVSGAIRDKDGATTSYASRVTVLNVAPVVTPTISGPISVRRGSLVTLTATFTDRAGDGPWTGRVSWGKGQGNGNLGNVVPGTAFAVTNSYSKAGTYQVTIEVRDVHNDTGSAVVTVVVQ